MKVGLFALVILGASITASRAGCIDVSKNPEVTLSGELTKQIFPGAPNFEDVRNGDQPEPTFILKLNKPICLAGDDAIDARTEVERIHVAAAEPQRSDLQRLIGQTISVTGNDVFGAQTGHHHAPVVMTALSARAAQEPQAPGEDQSGRTTVEAFYLALETGDGAAAARNVVPDKRASGPLSARALSAFYGSLKIPLKLIEVSALSPTRYRARYRFATRGGASCNGSALVSLERSSELNLISRDPLRDRLLTGPIVRLNRIYPDHTKT